ncbi:hypothetical protein IWX65_003371 [Arthrobacter sp. CAN_A214]
MAQNGAATPAEMATALLTGMLGVSIDAHYCHADQTKKWWLPFFPQCTDGYYDRLLGRVGDHQCPGFSRIVAAAKTAAKVFPTRRLPGEEGG